MEPQWSRGMGGGIMQDRQKQSKRQPFHPGYQKARITLSLLEEIANAERAAVANGGSLPKSMYAVRDTELRGFVLRCYPSSKKTFVCDYRLGGRRNTYVLGNTEVLSVAQARDCAKLILADVVRKIDPALAKRAREAAGKAENEQPTLEAFVDDEFTAWAEANLKTGAVSIKRLKSRFPDFLSKRLTEITAWQVEKWKSKRLKSGTSPFTVNRDLTVLSSAFTRAVEAKILTTHPLAGFNFCEVDTTQHKIRYLEKDEEIRLRRAMKARDDEARSERARANTWRAERSYDLYPSLEGVTFTDHLAVMVLLSMHTGMRRGEVFKLKWEDVDQNGKGLKVKGINSKNRKTRQIPLNKEAVWILQEWKRSSPSDSEFVFPGRDGEAITDVKKAWGKLLEDAEVKDFRWHDLRHHFASKLVMAGVDLNTVRDLLGHADLKMTLRYAHLAPHAKADAVERLVVHV